MNKLVFILLGLVIVVVVMKMQNKSSDDYQYIPEFNTELAYLTDTEQDMMLEEYKFQGFDLECFSNLKPNEKISEKDDYLCGSNIESAYNIPAKHMAIFFSKNKLTNVRLEFPNSSFELLKKHLEKTLKNYTRLDLRPGNTLDDSIIAWKTNNGIIATNKRLEGKILVLWSSKSTLSPLGKKAFQYIK